MYYCVTFFLPSLNTNKFSMSGFVVLMYFFPGSNTYKHLNNFNTQTQTPVFSVYFNKPCKWIIKGKFDNKM